MRKNTEIKEKKKCIQRQRLQKDSCYALYREQSPPIEQHRREAKYLTRLPVIGTDAEALMLCFVISKKKNNNKWKREEKCSFFFLAFLFLVLFLFEGA